MTSFEQARAAMVADLGEPTTSVTIDRPEGVDREPRRIEVLVYRLPARGRRPERTSFRTTGMSTATVRGPAAHVELNVYLNAPATDAQVQQTAQDLAALAFRVVDAQLPVDAFTLWDDASLALFPGRPSAFVTHGGFDEPEPVPETEGPTLVMDLTFLFPSEAEAIAASPTPMETFRDLSNALARQGKQVPDVERDPAV